MFMLQKANMRANNFFMLKLARQLLMLLS